MKGEHIDYLALLFRKLCLSRKALWFQKAILLRKTDREQEDPKIRHFDLECQAALAISNILSKKLHQNEMKVLYLLKEMSLKPNKIIPKTQKQKQQRQVKFSENPVYKVPNAQQIGCSDVVAYARNEQSWLQRLLAKVKSVNEQSLGWTKGTSRMEFNSPLSKYRQSKQVLSTYNTPKAGSYRAPKAGGFNTPKTCKADYKIYSPHPITEIGVNGKKNIDNEKKFLRRQYSYTEKNSGIRFARKWA